MTHSLLRSCSPLLLAAAVFVTAGPAHALLHTINFSDSSVTGSFDIDASLLTVPGSQINCNSGPPCGFNFFTVTFDGGEFTLDDLPGEVFRGNVGAGGFVDSLFILMDDNQGTGSGSFLNMDDDPLTFSIESDFFLSSAPGISANGINPVGTYTISVPEPALAGLLAFAAAGLVALRRRG